MRTELIRKNLTVIALSAAEVILLTVFGVFVYRFTHAPDGQQGTAVVPVPGTPMTAPPPPPAVAPGVCHRTGCAKQVCAEQEEITPCLYLPEYACYDTATCERQLGGACGFTPTPALSQCLKDAADRQLRMNQPLPQ